MEWIALKSGWLYEKQSGVASLLGHHKWSPRWVVVYGEPVPALGVYEQRSDATPPYAPLRHLNLPTGETQIKISDKSPDQRGNRPPSLLGWIRRLSVDVKGSMADLTLNTTDKDKVFWIIRGSIKLCFKTKSFAERDQWVGTLRGVLLCQFIPSSPTTSTTPQTRDTSIPASRPAASVIISRADARNRNGVPDETISCAGIVILEGKTVTRLRTVGSDSLSANPLQHNEDHSMKEDADSIVGVLTDSCAVINESSHETSWSDERKFNSINMNNYIRIVNEINFKYQQAMNDRHKSDKPKDLLRLELQLLKLLGRFQSLVTLRLMRIIDEYHHQGGSGALTKLETNFEDGPLRIMFIADFANAEEEIIAAAYAWFRQEIIASRWITSMPKSGFLQPLMTVAEYKGFRVLAMINLPLINQTTSIDCSNSMLLSATTSPINNRGTLIFNGEVGLVSDEIIAQRLKDLAINMNLVATQPYRLVADNGRVLQISLSPTLEVHRIEGSNTTNAYSSSKYNKERKTAQTPPGLYLVNVHDIIPAYPMTEELRGLLYFRPEFVKNLTAPVAPGEGQSESRQSVLKVLCDEKLFGLLEKLESLEEVPMDSEEWRQLLHSQGLNIALLGAIARETRLPHIREGAVIEMLARTVKLILRGRLRGAILHFREVQALRVEEELVAITLDTLNGVLVNEPVWVEELVGAVEDRFGFRIERELLRTINRNALLLALSHHCCIRLRSSAYAKSSPLRDDDFAGFGISLANGGNGPFTLTVNSQGDPLAAFANLTLSVGDNLWYLEGRRAVAAKLLLQVAAPKEDKGEWEEAHKLLELASSICPRHHPNQALIQLRMVAIKCQGPSNLPWRTMVLGEKPGAGSASSKEEMILEELKRARTSILHRLDRHYGPHHPLGVQMRMELAKLMEGWGGESGRQLALTLRQEAWNISFKILGRRHVYSQARLAELADCLRIAKSLDEAINHYEEALKLASDFDKGQIRQKGHPKETKAHLVLGLMQCWKLKGDLQQALEWAQQCRELLQAMVNDKNEWPTRDGLMEQVLEEIAELCIGLYEPSTKNQAQPETSTPPQLSMVRLASAEILAEPITRHLQTALECYGKLFEGRRNRHDLDSADGEALLRLAKKIVFLSLRLANPSQRPVVMAAARKKLFVSNINDDGGDDGTRLKVETSIKEWLVRMVAGPITPQEVVERVLNKAMTVETLKEAESELEVLLDLVEIVPN